MIVVLLLAGLTVSVVSFVRGWALMLAVPLAHHVLGTPNQHPGIWPCVGLAYLYGLLRAYQTVGGKKPAEAERG